MTSRATLWTLASLTLMLAACGTVKSPTEPSGGGHSVTVSNFQFTPSQLTVAVGDTVTWTNAGGFHNVVADDRSFRCAAGCDREGGDGAPSGAAWSFSRTFSTPGVVRYYCEVHGAPGGSGMSGTIVVTGGH